MLVLSVIQGPDKGKRFELPDNEPQMIGRCGEGLKLKDQTISRRHAELTPDDGNWMLNDLKSSNGTYINGRRLTRRTALQRGDQFRTGNTIFLFGEDATPARNRGVRVADADEINSTLIRAVPSNEDSMVLAVPDEREAAFFHLKVIYAVTEVVGSALDKAALLERIMDLIFEHFEADRGFVLLQEDPTQRPDPVVRRHRAAPKGKEDRQITVSRTIVHHVLRKAEGVLTSNAMADTRFSSGDSVQAFGIHSAMCVPITFKGRTFGVLYIDRQIANFTYTDTQLDLLTAIGAQTGMALSNAELMQDRMQRERLAAMGETVASLSHSTKNILQGMRGGADVVELGLKRENLKLVRNGWEIVSRNLERIYNLSLNMLAYSKQREPELEASSVPKLLEEIVALVQGQFDAKKVALIPDLDTDMPPIPLDPGGVHQAVLNLLQNALDAVEPGSGAVSLRCEFDPGEDAALIHVGDNGPGIDARTRGRLFQPFYSTKGLRGTGLGLAVTKKIIEEHAGRVSVESSPEAGTVFTLVLPAAHGDPAGTRGPGANTATT